MSNNNNPLAKFHVPADKQGRISALVKVPLISPPVLILIILSTGGVIASNVAALLGHLSLGWACALNTFLMYWQFTVVHDSVHRSASSNQTLNDWFGHIGIATFAPHINLGIFRWAHIQHHRFTNGAKDPDVWMHGPAWSLPLRWAFLDFGYLRFILRTRDKTGMKHLKDALRNTAVTAVIIAALVYFGYGAEVFWLWFVPARLTFMSVGFMFFWLPHVKDDVSSDEDLTLATSMRLGHEWLLNPVCQFHNYHLIHHLFPTMPCYRHSAAWKTLEPELMQRNLQIQHGFAIQPVVHHGH